METTPLPVVGVQNVGLCSTPKVFEGGALILYNLVVTRSLGFCDLVQRDAGPILRQAASTEDP